MTAFPCIFPNPPCTPASRSRCRRSEARIRQTTEARARQTDRSARKKIFCTTHDRGARTTNDRWHTFFPFRSVCFSLYLERLPTLPHVPVIRFVSPRPSICSPARLS
jgi:hypothetical protein